MALNCRGSVTQHIYPFFKMTPLADHDPKSRERLKNDKIPEKHDFDPFWTFPAIFVNMSNGAQYFALMVCGSEGGLGAIFIFFTFFML